MDLLYKKQFPLFLLSLMYLTFLTMGLPQPASSIVPRSDECGYMDFLGENEITLTADQQCYDFVINSTIKGNIGGCTCSFYASNAKASFNPANGTILLTKDIEILSNPKTASTVHAGPTNIATDNGVILCKDVNYSGGCFWFAATATCTDLESKYNNLGNTISSLMAFGCDGFFYEYADCSARGPTTYFVTNADGGVITLPAFSDYWNDRMQSFMCF